MRKIDTLEISSGRSRGMGWERGRGVGWGVVVEGGGCGVVVRVCVCVWGGGGTEHTPMMIFHLGANDGFEKCVFLQVSKQG